MGFRIAYRTRTGRRCGCERYNGVSRSIRGSKVTYDAYSRVLSVALLDVRARSAHQVYRRKHQEWRGCHSAGGQETLSACTSGTSCYEPQAYAHRANIDFDGQITNNVVTNQSANATLALGASPIMATAPEEMADLSKVIGSLLINFGTIQNLDGMLAAGKYSDHMAQTWITRLNCAHGNQEETPM